jgi:linoleate 9S-lipoxygenase
MLMIQKVLLLLLKHFLLFYTWTDPKTESRSGYVYIPRDELIGHVNSSDFLVNILNLAAQHATPQLRSLDTLKRSQLEFNTFNEVLSLFTEKFPLPKLIQGILIKIPSPSNIFNYIKNHIKKAHGSFENFVQ